jgi:hypothetical protein
MGGQGRVLKNGPGQIGKRTVLTAGHSGNALSGARENGHILLNKPHHPVVEFHFSHSGSFRLLKTEIGIIVTRLQQKLLLTAFGAV